MIALLLAAHALAGDPIELRFALGAQVDADPHGVADIGIRKGPWSAEILTDTLDLRYQRHSDQGRWWVALRVQGYAGGLMISPWTDGAPDPARSLIAGYAGPEAGVIQYLPYGAYLGAAVSARVWWFIRTKATDRDVPGPRPIGTVDAVAGWYRPFAHVWVRAGGDVWPDGVSPHVHLTATLQPEWTVAPRLEIRAGWADGTDEVTSTRIGGLNPYVVPLAGAAWAEFWAEDYVAVRTGPMLVLGSFTTGIVVDSAVFDGENAAGVGIMTEWAHRKGWFVHVAAGLPIRIETAPGVMRGSGWILIGREWWRIRGNR